MKKQTLIAISITTAVLSGCGTDNQPSLTPDPIQTVHVQTVNLVDFGNNKFSDVQLKAHHNGEEQTIYSGIIQYGSTSPSLLIAQQKSPAVPYTFKLFDTNSQNELAQKKLTLNSGDHKILFAFGDVDKGYYELSVQNKPNISSASSDEVPIYILDSSDVTNRYQTSVTVEGQTIDNLPSKTLSRALNVPKNQQEMTATFTHNGISKTCKFSTKDTPQMVILGPYSQCYGLSFLTSFED
ncbi:hypothetical protein [Vibrio harveyi]|uniref:hypothetical protein n=1 Tax=Vibrio harveyi TaxID=669 RepID=UPI0002C47EC5|nr:hypothetical protein [Vibrio harveyi]EMR33814.1 hypothetical protein MUQ_26024 [Vibrio harveyi CAIM 1792]